MHKKITIIIPCKNEEKYIAECINSIFKSNYPIDYVSILVVDGFSNDNTRNIVKKISEKNNQVKLIDNPNLTTPYALNIGINYSTDNIIIILGAHAKISQNFITENVKILSEMEDVTCSGGLVKNIYENDGARVIGAAFSSNFGVGNAHYRTGLKDGYVDTVLFGAYRKEVFTKVGFFDEDLTRNQDDEFNFRLRKHGYKIFLSHKIVSYYYVRSSYKKLFNQHFQYGYWKVFVNKKHKTITTTRQTIPALFVLFIAICLLITIFFTNFLILFIFVALLYFTVALLKSFQLKEIKLNEKYKIIYVFLILHFSYGLGYWNGIWDFILMDKKPKKFSLKLTR